MKHNYNLLYLPGQGSWYFESTVEALLTDTLVSGQFYLPLLSQKPRLSSRTNSVFTATDTLRGLRFRLSLASCC